MVSWLMMLIPLYIAYYTVMFARKIWRDGQKFAGVMIAVLLGGSLVVLPLWMQWTNRI